MTELLQHLVNGLSLGTVYALVALGYTMVYGVLKLINFAHSDVYMVGAFSGYWLGALLGADRAPNAGKAALVVLGAMAVCAALGFTIERLPHPPPLRDRGRLAALITAIGVSFLLEYGFQLNPWFRTPIEFPPGPAPRFFPALVDLGPAVELFGATVPRAELAGFLVAIALMLGLQWIVYRTRFGVAMRAVSFDAQVAGLMGIPVNRIVSGTFVLGSALAAAAGVINATARPRIEPLLGVLSGLKAFVAAVLGGIGSVPGAMAGGVLLGLVEEFVAGYTSSRYRDAIAFAVLILVLLLRPEGLLGKGRLEKV